MITTLLGKYKVESLQVLRTQKNIERCMSVVEKSGTKIVAPFLVTTKDNRKNIVCSCPECGKKFEQAIHHFTDKEFYFCRSCTPNDVTRLQEYNDKVNKTNIANIVKKLENSGIKILEQEEGNVRFTKWKCQCNQGHIFELSAQRLKVNKNPCPDCTYDSFEETIFRFLVEEVTGKTFEKIRPDWLQNPHSGKNMELDMYCEELNLAFEYNGIHHYKAIFGEERLALVQFKDQLCVELCKKQGVTLHTIKYLTDKVISNEKLIELAQEKLQSLGFKVTKKMCNKALERANSQHQVYSRQSKTLENIKRKLLLVNRQYVSGNYVNCKSKIQVRCTCCNHESTMRSGDVYMYVAHKHTCSKCKWQVIH